MQAQAACQQSTQASSNGMRAYSLQFAHLVPGVRRIMKERYVPTKERTHMKKLGLPLLRSGEGVRASSPVVRLVTMRVLLPSACSFLMVTDQMCLFCGALLLLRIRI
jgi:hypothetical protein